MPEKTEAKNKDFVISRVLNAPRELVWQSFTQPERMKEWWGPKGVKVIKSEMDLRVGGTYHYGMETPDGKVMWGRMVYREITRPARLLFINSFSDEAGGLSRHPLAPSWPLEMLSTFTFEEQPGGKTKFTVTWRPHNPTDEERATFDEGHASMTGGWTGTLDQFEAYLAKAAPVSEFGEGGFTLTRVLDVPRALVWQAWTDPKMMAHWFGPRHFTSSVPELDAKAGGRMCIVMHGPDGNDYPCAGAFIEVIKPERLVFTNNAIDNGGKVLLEGKTTVTFTEQGGKTTMTLKTYAVGRVAAAKKMLAGMEMGWTQSIDKLEELVAG